MIIKGFVILLAVLSITASVKADLKEDCDKMNLGDNWDKGLILDLQDDCNIDCSNISYSKNITETISIMKYCTGGEKEVP